MKILASAQACGFGPVSKLVAVSSLLGTDRVDFVGQGVALDYARRHAERFGAVHPADTTRGDLLAPRLADADAVISVMDADLVFWAVRHSRPVVFFDSLLHFWSRTHPAARLAGVARTVREGGTRAARTAFEALGPHQRILVAHLIADLSWAQNFPGVRERVAELAATGAGHIRLCGPVVDTATLHGALAEPADEQTAGSFLVNLGGFKNFYLDYASHNAYLHLMRRWVLDLAEKASDLDHVLVCCGGFTRPETVQVGTVRVEFTCLTHQDFLRRLAGTGMCAMPPSLTSLQEAVIARRMPLLLPEQHYGHIVNRRHLAGTAVSRHAACLTDLGGEYQVAEDDLEGTRELDRLTRRLVDDEPDYQQFRAHLDERTAAYRALTPKEREGAVDEVAALLGGPSLGSVIAELKGALLESGGRR